MLTLILLIVAAVIAGILMCGGSVPRINLVGGALFFYFLYILFVAFYGHAHH